MKIRMFRNENQTNDVANLLAFIIQWSLLSVLAYLLMIFYLWITIKASEIETSTTAKEIVMRYPYQVWACASDSLDLTKRKLIAGTTTLKGAGSMRPMGCYVVMHGNFIVSNPEWMSPSERKNPNSLPNQMVRKWKGKRAVIG